MNATRRIDFEHKNMHYTASPIIAIRFPGAQHLLQLAYMCLADANAMPVDGGDGEGEGGKSCLPSAAAAQNAAENRSSTPFPPLLSVHVFDLPKDTIHEHRKRISRYGNVQVNLGSWLKIGNKVEK